MLADEVYPGLIRHLEAFFTGHAVTLADAPPGPIQRVLPRFRVACIGPGPRTPLWTYASLGAWEVDGGAGGGLEFLLLVDRRDDEKNVLRLAMTAHYHDGEHLGEGHTFPLGEPWEPGSALDHVLVSLPYTFGPELEICPLPGGHVHFLWLLPITRAERDFRRSDGLDALEEKFEEGGIEYWNPFRRSMV